MRLGDIGNLRLRHLPKLLLGIGRELLIPDEVADRLPYRRIDVTGIFGVGPERCFDGVIDELHDAALRTVTDPFHRNVFDFDTRFHLIRDWDWDAIVFAPHMIEGWDDVYQPYYQAALEVISHRADMTSMIRWGGHEDVPGRIEVVRCIGEARPSAPAISIGAFQWARTLSEFGLCTRFGNSGFLEAAYGGGVILFAVGRDARQANDVLMAEAARFSERKIALHLGGDAAFDAVTVSMAEGIAMNAAGTVIRLPGSQDGIVQGVGAETASPSGSFQT